MSKDRIRPIQGWDENKLIRFDNEEEAKRWLNRNKDSSGNSNNNNSNDYNQNNNSIKNMSIEQIRNKMNKISMWNTNDSSDVAKSSSNTDPVDMDLDDISEPLHSEPGSLHSEPGSLQSSISSNSSKNSDYVKDPATDQKAIWDQIKQMQDTKKADLKYAENLDREINSPKKDNTDWAVIAHMSEQQKILNQIRSEQEGLKGTSIKEQEELFARFSQVQEDQKVAQNSPKEDNTDWAVIAHMPEQQEILDQIRSEQEGLKGTSIKEQEELLARFLQENEDRKVAQLEQDKEDHEEFKLRVKQKLKLKQQQEEKEAQQQESLVTKAKAYFQGFNVEESTKTTSYLAKNYKTFLDFAKNVGFHVSDETANLVKYGAHGVHAISNFVNALYTNKIASNFIDVLGFGMHDFINVENTEVKCGLQAFGSLLSKDTLLNPSGSVINSGLTFLECEIESNVAKQYPLLLSSVRTVKAVNKLLSIYGALYKGVDVMPNIVLGSIELLNVFNQVSSLQVTKEIATNSMPDTDNTSSFLSGVWNYLYGTSNAEDSFDAL